MARPAEMLPPGELMYMWTSVLGSSDWRKSNWATTALATSSVICEPMKMMRSFSRRL